MRTIVMTGGTTGFGALAVQQIAPHARLLLGARRMSPSIHSAPIDAARIDTAPLDLASLEAVAEFAEHVGAWLNGSSLDTLVLNAGTIGRDVDHRTPDGVERTFAVNHLAHHQLLNLLWHHLASDATLVATTSGTHDPAEKASLPTPHHADAFRLAYPDRDPDRDRNPHPRPSARTPRRSCAGSSPSAPPPTAASPPSPSAPVRRPEPDWCAPCPFRCGSPGNWVGRRLICCRGSTLAQMPPGR